MAKVDQTVTNTQEVLTQRQNEMESFGGGGKCMACVCFCVQIDSDAGEEMHFYAAIRPPASMLEREAPCILFLFIIIFLVLPTVVIIYKTMYSQHDDPYAYNKTAQHT